MILVTVEALLAESKPPAAVSVRISTSERHGFGAAAPSSTKMSCLRGRAGGLAFMPKLVELVGPAWILFAESNSIEVRHRGFARPESILMGNGAIALGDSLAPVA